MTAMQWIDSHCHLQDEYRPEGTGVVGAAEAASEQGVAGLICVGTGPASSREAVAVAGLLRSVVGPDQGAFESWATIGLHPHDAVQGLAETESVLDSALKESPGVVVAVGECGLDYHYDNSPRDVQRAVFAEQVTWARKHNLTLVVHSRDAWDDTLDILDVEDGPERIVLHCFTGDADAASRCLDLGAFLSFSGIVTFKNASDVRDALKICPADRLLVETDAPFLAPVPHRGEQNQPAWVRVVGEAVAQIRSEPVEVVASSTVAATRAAFDLDRPPDLS